MKKILLIFILLLSISSFAQLFNYDASELGLRSNYVALPKTPGNCATHINVLATFDEPIRWPSDAGNGYYELHFLLYGVKNNVATLIEDKLVPTDSNSPATNGLGYYQMYPNLPNGSTASHSIENLSYTHYYSKIKIIEYLYNNDPGMGMYVPWVFYNSQNSTWGAVCPESFVDTDGDGVADSLDKCPGHDDNIDTDGDGIPDGCDNTNNNAKPNLTLSGFKVKVGTTTYDTFATTNNIPEFKYGENHTFTVKIGNNDGGNASSSNCKILVSEENTYPNIGSKPIYEYRTFNLGAISGNSNKENIISEYFYDNISLLNLQNDKTYYLIVHIDYNNNVNESNESYSDNIKYVKFKYKKSSSSAIGKIGLKVNSNGATIDVDFNYDSYNNNLKIYSLNYGIYKYNSDVYGQNPKVDLSAYANGIYAIYVDGVYIKKIGLNTGMQPVPITP